jgi:predicted phosphoribosyltransferase
VRDDGRGRERSRPYADRSEAGAELARHLTGYAARSDVVVLGLPRGGVPVAAAIASALGAPLDVLLVRKLGLPGHAELAMGAIAGVGDDIVVVRNEDVLGHARVSAEAFERVRCAEATELRRREGAYRGDRPGADLTGRTVIVVDDGLATGSTMRAAVRALRQAGPAGIVIAVPIGAPRTCAELSAEVDEVVCPWQPQRFWAVGQGYRDFGQTSDEEVTRLLR